MVERVSSRRKPADEDVAPARAAAGQRVLPKFDKKTIALVYDFDGTLSPKPMQEYAFLPEIGADAAAFWAESNALAKKTQADPLITYMHLMYKKAKAKGVHIDRRDLVAQGQRVEFYPGVETWFDAIGAYVKSHAQSHGVHLRHYLISSGLTEIVEGTSIYKRFHNVFASEYWFEAYELPYPKRVITDTGKTQYLFRINKGVEDLGESINQHMPEDQRPVP
ncbi:MAG: haloacid dehalogenase-like hydrolase, partial [Rhodospirillales bacterium]|nr:haloacid dehalogenase-like hydrolase [Rhodospirillales bacterium]